MHFALRAWRGCLRGQLATRSTPRRWPRLLSNDTAPGRRLLLRTVVAVSLSVPWRAARARVAPWITSRPPTDARTARCVLGAVVCAANSRRAPPHAVGRGSSPPTPRQVGGCGFGTSLPSVSSPVARGPRALRHVENQPTAHRACTARCVLGAVVCAANSRRAPPHAVGRGSSPLTPRFVGGCGFESSWPSLSSPVTRGARALRHVENQPTAHRALVSARCVLGAVVCAANSRRAPPHAVGRSSSPPTPRQVGGCGFETSCRLILVPWRAAGARFVTWRTSRPPTEHGLRAACLARLSARPTRDALHPTPLAEALLQLHRARSAGAASDRRSRIIINPWRAARARVAPWITSQPPTTHELRVACLARLSARPTRDALHLTQLVEDPRH